MALIKCPECGKEISDRAEVCIHCGLPFKKMGEDIDWFDQNAEEDERAIHRIEDSEDGVFLFVTTKGPLLFSGQQVRLWDGEDNLIAQYPIMSVRYEKDTAVLSLDVAESSDAALFSELGPVSISIHDEKEKYAKGSLDEVKERARKKTDSVDRNGKLQIFEMERRSKEVSFCVWSDAAEINSGKQVCLWNESGELIGQYQIVSVKRRENQEIVVSLFMQNKNELDLLMDACPVALSIYDANSVKLAGMMDEILSKEREEKSTASSKYNVSNVPKCPVCGSTSIQGMKKGFSAGRAAAGGILLGPLGVLAGAAGGNEVERVCLNCGYRF